METASIPASQVQLKPPKSLHALPSFKHSGINEFAKTSGFSMIGPNWGFRGKPARVLIASTAAEN
jgi:hypothetical protein